MNNPEAQMRRCVPVVMLRHAQSEWNLQQRFTGWSDVSLSDAGMEEARAAGRLLRVRQFQFDRAYISYQKRTRETLDGVMAELGQGTLPFIRDWRLNERHYGALQGLNKIETAHRYGADQVLRWRRGFHDKPPALALDDPRHPRFDPTYTELATDLLPATESLADTQVRVIAFWQEQILPRIHAQELLLIVAHGNSLRALVGWLSGMSDVEIEKFEIPTGLPLIYGFKADATPLGWYYLGLQPTPCEQESQVA